MGVVGYAITRGGLDNQIGGLVTNLRNALNEIVFFNALLNDSSILSTSFMTTTLVNPYTGGEDTQIRASFTDLQKLSDISRNAATQSATNDFWFNAKHLAGSGFH
jgi:hypothetical protein